MKVRHRPVTRVGRRGGEDPLEIFSPPLEKCVGHSLKTLDIVRVARSLDIFSRTFCFSKRYGGLLQWAFAGGANWPFGPRKLD